MTTEAKVGAFTVVGVVLFAAVAARRVVPLVGARGDTALYAGFKQVIGVEPESVVRLSGRSCSAGSRASATMAAV